MQAALTQPPRDHTPTEPLRAFGGRKTVAIEVRGDLRTAQTTAASGVDPVEEDLVRRELVIPRDRSNDTMLTAHPTRPVDRDRDVFALARDINGDTLKHQAHHLLPVSRGGLRRLPQGRPVLGEPPDRVSLLARQLGGVLPVKPCLIFVPLLFLASGLFPAPLQCSRHQAVFRLNSSILPGRTLCLLVAPLETLLPMRLQLCAPGPSCVFCRATSLSRGGLEHVQHLRDHNTIQEGPGETQAQRRPIITHTPAAAVAQTIRPATVCRYQAPPAPPTHQQAS